MGWTFKWVSSFGNDFNYDYGLLDSGVGEDGKPGVQEPMSLRR
jgi:predicted dithiol-disulfide oxidoreductase (DUF899 family)